MGDRVTRGLPGAIERFKALKAQDPTVPGWFMPDETVLLHDLLVDIKYYCDDKLKRLDP